MRPISDENAQRSTHLRGTLPPSQAHWRTAVAVAEAGWRTAVALTNAVRIAEERDETRSVHAGLRLARCQGVMSIEHEDALASVDEGCRAYRAAGQGVVDLERRTPSVETPNAQGRAPNVERERTLNPER